MSTLQTVSTCKRDEDFDLFPKEKQDIMNLDHLETSPYLKHPIWFLGTMKNTKCHIRKGYSGLKVKTGKNASKDSIESASYTPTHAAYTVLYLGLILDCLL